MNDVIRDLVAEQMAVEKFVDGLAENLWDRKVQFCSEWSVKDTIMHIAFWDYSANKILNGDASDLLSALQEGELDKYLRVTKYEKLSKSEVLIWWRLKRKELIYNLMCLDPKSRIVWIPGESMSVKTLATARLMELWAHSIDIYDMLKIKPFVTDRLKHILMLAYLAGPNSYKINKIDLPKESIYFELTLPSGEIWVKGNIEDYNYIKGSALEWALVSVRRRNWKDTKLKVNGRAAKQFASIVQAYAGQPDPSFL